MTYVAVDHLVVGAASLEQGVAWCEATLGVTPGPGGQHPLMGTHNRLLKISGEHYPQAYLEIIAIDPAAPPPGRPRWFGLDEVDLSAGPRLLHWVGRSPMLDMHRWGLITVGQPPGDPVKAGRDTPQGRLEWQILLRPDGRPLCGGALPTLLQWGAVHPTDHMPDSGVTLQRLGLGGLPAKVREVLRLRQVDDLVADGAVPPPALRATLQTPRGPVTLESRTGTTA
jgi:hypothetical protein